MAPAWSEGRAGRRSWAMVLAVVAGTLAGCGDDGPTDPGGDGGETPEPLPGTWTTAAAIPLGLADAAVTVHDGRIYVIGGRSNDSTLVARTYRYDPTNNSWDRLADIGEPLANSAAGVHDGRVMLLGGNASANAVNPRAAVRSLADGAWTLHSALPSQSIAPKAVSRDGGLWVIETGSVPAPPRGSAFLPSGASEWVALNDGLPPLTAGVFVGDGDRAWAVDFQRVAEYRDGAWSEPYNLPDGFLVGAWAAGGRLYVLTRQANRASMRMRDPATSSWVALAAPEEDIQRTNVMTATVNGRLYLIGGRVASPSGGMMTRVDVFTPPS